MKKNENYLFAFFEIINSDINELLEEVRPYEDKIREMKEKIRFLINKNLAEARILKGRELQEKFDSSDFSDEDYDFSKLSIAARGKNNDLKESNLSDKEKRDVVKLSKLKKDDEK